MKAYGGKPRFSKNNIHLVINFYWYRFTTTKSPCNVQDTNWTPHFNRCTEKGDTTKTLYSLIVVIPSETIKKYLSTIQNSFSLAYYK